MKLKCIASNTEWFTEGKKYKHVHNRYGSDLVLDNADDEWLTAYVDNGLWVVGENAVFQEVEE